jgi:ADP-heptose:LPS heptosyltransferase
MSESITPETAQGAPMDRRLAILLAMAMFVLVVDTSIMNVSIGCDAFPTSSAGEGMLMG